MNRPNLSRMYETFIKTTWEDYFSARHVAAMRSRVFPMLKRLSEEDKIDWYCVLVHAGRETGIPSDDPDPYFHIRVAFTKEYTDEEIRSDLPSDLPEGPRKISGNKISGIDESLYKNGDIAEAWRIAGEQTEWLFRMLDSFKEDVVAPYTQIGQFLHYYVNATNVAVGGNNDYDMARSQDHISKLFRIPVQRASTTK